METLQQFFMFSVLCCYSESMSKIVGGIGDVGVVGVFLLVDASTEAACASICCFGKSWDGHSKCTQWKIWIEKKNGI